MQLFEYSRATDVAGAIASHSLQTSFIAGGTTLLDLMKLDVERPHKLIDINQLPLNKVEKTAGGGVRIGALVRNSDLAHHPHITGQYPVLSEALLSGASAQLRNMATTGGNLLQRTRCVYFRDTSMACNKREPGSGCSAIDGHNRMLAILGTSEHCIASNPSDMNVALTALEATIHISGAKGDRSVPIHDFYTLPGNTPHIENVLEPGDLITHVSLPAPPAGSKSLYVKLRDRASYEFALASAAVVLSVNGGNVQQVRLAMGGIGAKPWRCLNAEKALLGKAATPENFSAAASSELNAAKPQSENAFKVELAARCLRHALSQAVSLA